MPTDGVFTTSLVDPLLYHHGNVGLNLNTKLNYINILFNLVVALFIIIPVYYLLKWRASRPSDATNHNRLLWRRST